MSKEFDEFMSSMSEIPTNSKDDVKGGELATFTEEDIDKLLSLYTDDAPASYIKRDYKKYLQSLKQPKQ